MRCNRLAIRGERPLLTTAAVSFLIYNPLLLANARWRWSSFKLTDFVSYTHATPPPPPHPFGHGREREGWFLVFLLFIIRIASMSQ